MKCPNCKSEMEVSGGVATCPKCGARYKATEQTREHMTAPPTSPPFEATTSPSKANDLQDIKRCLLYTSPSPRDRQKARMPSSA